MKWYIYNGVSPDRTLEILLTLTLTEFDSQRPPFSKNRTYLTLTLTLTINITVPVTVTATLTEAQADMYILISNF